MGRWFEVDVTCERPLLREELLRVGNLVQFLRAECGLERWHYFLFEPWATITVRVRVPDSGFAADLGDESNPSSWVALCTRHLAPERGPEVFLRFSPYQEEVTEYGDTVEAVLKFHEAASEVGLLMAQGKDDQRPNNFHASKLIHCTLNEWGFDWPAEAAMLERMAFWRRTMAQIAQRPGGMPWLVKAIEAVGPPSRAEPELQRWQ